MSNIFNSKHKCSRCETVFDDNGVKYIAETVRFGNDSWIGKIAVCPYCNAESEDWYSFTECEICGEEKADDEFVEGNEVCKECAKKVVAKFDKLIDNNFKAVEIEFLYSNWNILDDIKEGKR